MQAVKTIRVSYLLFYISFGLYSPYLSLYLKRQDWNEVKIGLALCLTSLLGFVGQFAFGYLSDRTGRKRELIAILAIISSVFGFLLIGSKGIFLFSLVALLGFTRYPLIPLLDSVSFDQLSGKQREKFGHLRIFGTIGYLLASATASLFLLPMVGLYSVFYGFSIVTFISIFWLRGFPESPTTTNNELAGQRLSDYRIYWIAAMMFLLELGGTCVQGYLGIYIDKFYASDSLIPIAWSVALISEILLFQAAPYFLKQFSARTILIIGGGSAAVRYIFLSTAFATHSPIYFLISQLLHGLYYGLFSCVILAFLDICSPAHRRATVLSNVGAFSKHGGFITGYFVSGWVWRVFGLQALFFFSGCIALVGLLILSHPILSELSHPITRNATPE